jgi:hypothetical protein
MCKCLQVSEDNAIEHISKKLSERYSGFELNKEDSGYINKVLSFSTGGLHLIMPFEVRYTFQKKDGTRSSGKVEKTSIFPTFCPFCGIKIERKKDGL